MEVCYPVPTRLLRNFDVVASTEDSSTLKLHCLCGGERFFLHYSGMRSKLLSPMLRRDKKSKRLVVVARCALCNAELLLLDTDIDGEIHYPPQMPAVFSTEQLECPKCGTDTFGIKALYSSRGREDLLAHGKTHTNDCYYYVAFDASCAECDRRTRLVDEDM